MSLNLNNVDSQLTASPVAVISVSGPTQALILKATATNTDNAAHTITVYRVPNGGTAGTTNIIGADAVPIGAGETITVPIAGQSLVNGQALEAEADAAGAVNLNVSYSTTP